MNMIRDFILTHASRLLVLLLLLIPYGYGLARLPEISDAERGFLASRFKFMEDTLLQIPGPYPISRKVRSVHPSLQHISAWISSVGASVALNDLDGDGYPNDVCYVDTMSDQVVVLPAPGTEYDEKGQPRYKAFGLTPAILTYDHATMAPMGCLPGDINADGRRDIVVYYWGRSPVAYIHHSERRDSKRRLSKESYLEQELLPGNQRWFSNAGTIADFDGDGHVDILIGNYFRDGAHILDAHGTGTEEMQMSMSRAFNGGEKHLLLWTGPTDSNESVAHFRDVPMGLTPEVAHGWNLAIGAVDLDGDLLPEIYLANDFGPDRLLYNRSQPGHPAFSLVEGKKGWLTPNSKVLGRDSFKGMGVDFADLNMDGILDIFVSNITNEYALQESHFAFLSRGSTDSIKLGIAPYVDESESLGLSRSYWSWDARFADFNNDGVFEIIQATGFIRGTVNRWPELHETAMGNDDRLHDPRSWHRIQPGDDLSGNQPNPFFVQSSNGQYVDLSEKIGIGEPHVSRGIAIADVDGDGRLDFALANQWEPSFFYHNQSLEAGSFLGLHLLLRLPKDTSSVPDLLPGHPPKGLLAVPAIGATARILLPNGKRLIGQVDGGNGHSGKRSPALHFGLGKETLDTPMEVEISWRGLDGETHRKRYHLGPNWHTILL